MILNIQQHLRNRDHRTMDRTSYWATWFGYRTFWVLDYKRLYRM